jgi:hypothetical protein
VVLSSLEHGKDAGRREHRVVMERIVGRALSAHEVVHHINGDKSDNNPENLRIDTRASHNREHGKGRLLVCARCGASRWYSRALISLMTSAQYMCRTCRFGKTWNNGRKS